jgi:hypothetical protein
MARPSKQAAPTAAKPRNGSAGPKGPLGSNTPGNRSGQGAGSALAELLRRQAQNPRPGAGQQQPARDDEPGREPRPVAPRRSGG